MDNIYIGFARRWWWLMAASAVIALAATHYAIAQQKPLYRAIATIQVGRVIESKNPDQAELAIIDRLVPAYAELAKRDPVLLATIQTLNLPLTPNDLRARLLVAPVPRAPLIDIAVVDADPARAAAIANEIARQVVLQSPAPSQQDQSGQAFIQQQLGDLQAKITRGQAEITALQNQIAGMISASDIEEARRKLAAQEAQVESWQTSYARLIGAAEPSKTNLVSVAGQATAPSVPLPPRNTLYYALALVVSVGLATVLALLLDLLNRAVSKPEEVGALVSGLPVLTIPRYRLPRRLGAILAAEPHSGASAAYRLLRNTLYVRSEGEAGMTIAVTSSRVAEGKTTTATNLAIALANTGRTVILVDANLHNPEIDQWFNVQALPGFSDLLLGDSPYTSVLQPTEHANLLVIAAGSIPADYADLLSMHEVGKVIAALARAADVVLFDSPAVAEEQDSLLLSKHVQGVLLVAEAGRIQKGELRKTLDLLEHASTTVVAIALNKVRPRRFSLQAPWSREARNRARAQQRRRAHNLGAVLDGGVVANREAPGD